MAMTFETPVNPNANNTLNLGTSTNKWKVNGLVTGNAQIFYGTSASTAANIAKTVICPDFTAAALIEGSTVKVKFQYSNTASNPTLNVNSTGAKSIYRYGTTEPSTTEGSSWSAGAVISFTYDGSAWQMNDWQNVDDVISNSDINDAYNTVFNS